MQYDDWPIARLIEQELRDPSLPKLVRDQPQLRPVVLVWERDCWQATSRPDIQEKGIAYVQLGDLDDPQWKDMLEEARACLDPRRRYRGRATQLVTLPDGTQVEREVSPHLMFRYMDPERVEWEDLCREGKACMQPLHDWAVRRARQPVRF
jgi:hypothetical protein